MGIIAAMINEVEINREGKRRVDVDLKCINVNSHQCFDVINGILACVSKATNISKDQALDDFLDHYRNNNRTDELV